MSSPCPFLFGETGLVAKQVHGRRQNGDQDDEPVPRQHAVGDHVARPAAQLERRRARGRGGRSRRRGGGTAEEGRLVGRRRQLGRGRHLLGAQRRVRRGGGDAAHVGARRAQGQRLAGAAGGVGDDLAEQQGLVLANVGRQ